MGKHVGLVIMTEISVEGELRYASLMQQRAEENTEKGIPESYARCWQVSCYGEVEEGETFDQALIREWCEELGKDFALWWQKYMPSPEKIWEFKSEDGATHTVIYMIFVPRDMIEHAIKQGPDVRDLKYFLEQEIWMAVLATGRMRWRGAPENVTAVFPSSIQAVTKAFELTEAHPPSR